MHIAPFSRRRIHLAVNTTSVWEETVAAHRAISVFAAGCANVVTDPYVRRVSGLAQRQGMEHDTPHKHYSYDIFF